MKLDNRLWVLVTIIVCGALLAGGWFLGVQPQLAAVSAADEARLAASAQNTALSAQITSLTKAKANEGELKSQLSELVKSVPAGVSGSSFLREVNGLVASTGVALQAVTIQQPLPYAAPVDPTAAASTGTTGNASPSPSPTPSASASASSEPSATVAAPTSVSPLTDPLITGSNFVTVPVILEVKGSAAQVDAFLSGLQHGDRLVLVSKVDRNVDDDGVMDLKAQGFIYVLRDPSTVSTSTTPAATTNG